MRIKSVLAVFITGLSLAVAGCGTEAQVVTSEPAPVEEQTSQESSSLAKGCPLKWTCDYQSYYNTQAQCSAACGGATCDRDYACNGTCICP